MLGGPVIKNKAHFFVSLERQVDKPNRTRVFPTRPSLDFSIVEDRNDWNTMIRFDHQISSNHTWAVRWLRELAPQYPIVVNRSTLDTFQDETDLNQTAVFTFTSVLGGAKVNTFRFAKTWEHWWHGNDCSRAQGGGDSWEGFAFGEEDSSTRRCARRSSTTSASSPAQHRIAGAVGPELPGRGQPLVVRARQEGRPRPEDRRALQLDRAAPRLQINRTAPSASTPTCRSTPPIPAPIPSASPSASPTRTTRR